MTNEPATHAKLSPSAAYRWVACPGSIQLSAGLPSSTSLAADEGTAAHFVAQLCLMQNADPLSFVGKVFDAATGDFVAGIQAVSDTSRMVQVTAEMAEHIDTYLAHINSLFYATAHSELSVESRLHMAHIHEDMFGTADAVLYLADEKHIHVIDLKYGKQYVEVLGNRQLLLYASAALHKRHNSGVEKVTITIVQPRAGHEAVRSHTVTAEYITKEFDPAMRAAAAATQEASPRFKYGEHCTFCPAAGFCPTATAAVASAIEEFTAVGVEKMTNSARLQFLKEIGLIEKTIEAFKNQLKADFLAGKLDETFELKTKLAPRKWRNETAVAAALEQYIDNVFTLRSPSAVKQDLKALLGAAAADAALDPLLTEAETQSWVVPAKGNNDFGG